ncbi:MAG: cytochrome bc1 complex Rieske iron-sulfur subunit [Iamia sp.]
MTDAANGGADPADDADAVAEKGCMGCPGAESEAARAEREARSRRAELLVASGFLVSAAAAIALGVVYWVGGQTQLEGIFLAVALAGLGIGFILWSKEFMPHQPVVEARHPIASSEEEIDAFREEFEQGESILTRRKLLVRSAGAAMAALGAALLFPIRSLGPRPGKGLKTTPFKAGTHLVTADNQRVKPEAINLNGVLTVFPEVANDPDAVGEVVAPDVQADAATLLIRPDEPVDPVEGREGWTQDGVVAYSKICTHVGCPVGLYEAQAHLLLCPCHQSTFEVLNGAKPIFGPAARALPQLPISLDDEGFLIADGDFSSPTGPGFWDRDR